MATTLALQPAATLQPSAYLQPQAGAQYGVSPESAEQLFRTTGTVRANLTDATTYTINGVPLENYARILGADEGLIAPADTPDVTVKVPGRHGVIDIGGTYGTSQITFTGTILGVDPTTGAYAEGQTFGTYMQRVDELMRLFTAPKLVVVATRPDGTTRQATGRLLGSIAPAQQPGNPWFGRFRAVIRIPGAFWEDVNPVTQNITGPSGTVVALTEFAGATAPMSDLVITTLTPVSNPLLIHGSRTFQYQGVITGSRQLVTNTGNWTVSPGTGAPWTPDLRQVSFDPGPGLGGTRWLELDPSLTPFAVTFVHTGGGTASMSITGRRRYYNP